VADAAQRAQQLDGLHHVVEVVGRLAHAHEHHLLHHPPAARQRHLGHDLGAAHLAQQAFAPGHAEQAAHRTAHLRRDTQAVARQQHAFHRLAVGQVHQQPRGAVFGRMFGAQARQACQLCLQGRQGLAQGLRQQVLGPPPAAVLRQGLGPQAQHALFMEGFGAQRTQALAQGFDAHGPDCGRPGWAGRSAGAGAGTPGPGANIHTGGGLRSAKPPWCQYG